MLPDFSRKTAGFRLAEKPEEEWEPFDEETVIYARKTVAFGGVLERIAEEYYPGCEAHKIYYDTECLENMERLLGDMLPEYFYGIETEEGTGSRKAISIEFGIWNYPACAIISRRCKAYSLKDSGSFFISSVSSKKHKLST